MLLVALAGCSREPHHPDWVIHSSIEVIGPPPAGGYRLIFPYIVGDLYGSSNTGAFRRAGDAGHPPASHSTSTARRRRWRRSSGPPISSSDFMKIMPRDARLARLAPVALQRDGIDAVGTMDWLDAQSRRSLMLVYVDRPARIEGAITRGGKTIRYDVRVARPGYVWIGAIETGGHDTLYTAVPPPQHPVLTITAKR